MAQDWGNPLTPQQKAVVQKAQQKAIKLCQDVIADADLQTRLRALEEVGWRQTSSRTEGVRNDFRKIQKALSTMKEIDFKVKTGKFFAEVLPNMPGMITLADLFWKAEDKGSNSKAGTLIHEASHWEGVRGTEDHAYGKSIQKLSFTKSRNNADTIEAIAESYDR